jgi:hypothetical protein
LFIIKVITYFLTKVLIPKPEKYYNGFLHVLFTINITTFWSTLPCLDL